MTITPTARRVLLAAADWLEANRDKHIVGAMARNSEGIAVAPTDPSANCFCALGRIANEAGIVGYHDDDGFPSDEPTDEISSGPYDALEKWMRDNGVEQRDIALAIWSLNDTHTGRDDPDRGNPAVITKLRRIADGELDA